MSCFMQMSGLPLNGVSLKSKVVHIGEKKKQKGREWKRKADMKKAQKGQYKEDLFLSFWKLKGSRKD